MLHLFPENTIKYIIHLSDIHIRNGQNRIDEYILVFDNLESKIKEILQSNKILGDNIIIYIAGDVYDNTGNIDSHSLYLFHHLFEKLTNLANVIIIPGNHDNNIKTNTEYDYDMISSSFGKVEWKSKYTYYYSKKSETFLVGQNLILYHISVFDTEKISKSHIKDIHRKEKYDKLLPNKLNDNSKKHILLLHESITGTLLPNKTKLNKSCIYNIGDIKYFDYVLLGDIHTTNNVIYNQPDCKIAYPGSLIQQNYGESFGDHGFFLWDIINDNYDFHIIDNDYGYKKIIYHLGIDNEIFPKFTRLQVLTDHSVTANEFKHFVDNIKFKTTILNNNVLRTHKINLNNSNISNPIDNKFTFQKYINNETNYNQIIKNKLIDIHKEYNKKKDLSNSKCVWNILTLHLHNIFCFTDFFIDFSNFYSLSNLTGSILGIFGPNGSGKSSIPNAILYTLYGYGSIGLTIGDIHNKNNMNSTNFSEISLSINDIVYVIKRSMKNPRNVKNKHHTLSLFKIHNNDKYDITGINISDTQNKINLLIGDHYYLNNSHISRQNNYNNILFGSDYDILIKLKKFLALDYYDLINNKINSRIKDLNKKIYFNEGELKQLNIKIKSYNINSLNLNIKNIKSSILKFESKLSKINSNISLSNNFINENNDMCYNNLNKLNDDILQIENKILQNNLSLSNHSGNSYDLNIINKKIKNINKKISIINKNKKKFFDKKFKFIKSVKKNNIPLSNDLSDFEIEIIDNSFLTNKINDLKSQLKNIILDENPPTIIKNKTKFQNIVDKFLFHKNNITDIENKLSFFDKYNHFIFDENCHSCNVNKKSLLDINANHKKKIIFDNLIKSKKFVDDNKNCVDLLDIYKSKYDKCLLKFKLRYYFIHYKSLLFSNNINKFQNKLKDLNDIKYQILDFNELKKKYSSDNLILSCELKKLLHFNNIYNDYFVNKNKLFSLNNEKINISNKLTSFKCNLDNLNDKYSLYIKDVNHFNKLNNDNNLFKDDFNILKIYKSEIGIKGFQQYLLKNKIFRFVHEINIFLNNIVDFKVDIDFNFDKKTVSFFKIVNNVRFSFKSLSGFETFIISIAFRLSLHNICDDICFSNFFIIDEGFGTFDSKHINNVKEILEFLKSKFLLTVVITHVDDIKKSFNNKIILSS
jgi:DNA repair exonuclease SbcCD ATPase subunit